jgi:hypothetical protein
VPNDDEDPVAEPTPDTPPEPAADSTPEQLLDGLADRPLEEHPAAFAAIDEALTSELSAFDDPD